MALSRALANRAVWGYWPPNGSFTGETKYDMFAWDMARFGDWADAAFTKARVGDQYAHRFKIHFPNEERDAGRPVRTRPIFEKQKELGATFGLNYGWEHALYFDAETPETAGFTRQGWWHSVGREAQMLRDSVGVIDISNFGKYSVKGAGAEEWLNAVFANKMPSVVGRSCLTPLIGKRGGIAGDATVTKLGEDEYWGGQFGHGRTLSTALLSNGGSAQGHDV